MKNKLFVGFVEILMMTASSREVNLLMMVTSVVLCGGFTINLVSMHNVGGSKFLRSIIETPRLRKRLCGILWGNRERDFHERLNQLIGTYKWLLESFPLNHG